MSFLNNYKKMNSSLIFKFFVLLISVFLIVSSCNESDDFNEGPFFSKRTEILSFEFQELSPSVAANINTQDRLITASLPFGTDFTSLAPTITVSPKATITPPSGVANDFSDTTNYIVNAEDGSTQEWRVILRESDEEAQPRLVLSDPEWNLSPSGTGIPEFFTPDGERGLAYGNDHVYVTNNNDNILILDPADGSQLGSLDMTGVEGGAPKIADVAMSDDGTILACNTVEYTSDGGGEATTFKIYKWNDEASEPEVFLTYTNTQYRMGDSFSVIGDINTNAVILTCFGRKFLNPTTRGSIIFRWNVVNGVVDATPELIEVTNVPNLSKFGSRPHAQMLSIDSESYISNANDIEFTQSNLDGSFIGRIPNLGRDLYDGFTSYFELFEFAGKTVIATAFPRSASESRLIVIDITNGLDQVTADDVILSQDFVTGSEIANANASGAVAVNVTGDNSAEIYCLITNQAVVKFNLSTVLD